jgi:hypothetical protein
MTRCSFAVAAALAGCANTPHSTPVDGAADATADARVVSTAQIVIMANDGEPPGGGMASDLVAMNLDGTNRTQLTHDPELEFLPHFSHDGTRVLYTKYRTGTYGQGDSIVDIALYDFTTDQETLLTSRGDAVQGVWSPDGSSIAFVATRESQIWLMDADGGNPRLVAESTHTDRDQQWGDLAWSSDDWILFAVAEEPSGPCFKTRLDKIRPDGSSRTQVSGGGPSCTPSGMEQSGDADAAFSPDGRTIYTSRGLPRAPAGASPPTTDRKLVALECDAWSSTQPERDLSLPTEPDCIEGVPKASPDGTRILEYRACFDTPGVRGTYLVDASGLTRTFVAEGFGADWNPVAP